MFDSCDITKLCYSIPVLQQRFRSDSKIQSLCHVILCTGLRCDWLLHLRLRVRGEDRSESAKLTPLCNMSLSKPKKRKIDVENRQFQSEWTDKYLFVLPAATSNKPVCLLCNDCIAVMKEYNLKRHYTSNHGSFSASFPEGSEEQRGKVQRLLTSFQKCQVSSVAFARNKRGL